MDEKELPLANDPRFKHCFETTTVNYPKHKRKFHHPRLRSFNHLEIGKSKLTKNPFARIALWFVEMYWAIKEWIKKVHDWLYPRRLTIHGLEKNSQLVGKLYYGQKTVDIDVPIHCKSSTKSGPDLVIS